MNSRKTIEKTKLIKLLTSFSALEWKRFGRFVQSPFFNSNETVIQLYTTLKKAFPFDQLKNLEEERIYKKIYGKEPFNVVKFRNLTSDLYKLAEEFVIQMHLNKKKRKKEKILIDALSERNYELFKGNSLQLIKEIEMQEYFMDEEDFLLLYHLFNGLYHHLENDNFTTQKIELEQSQRFLIAFYENTQIQIKAESNSARNFLNQIVNSEKATNNFLTELYQGIEELHISNQATLYFKLKERIFKHWDRLKIPHKTNLLVHLLNFSFTNELITNELGHRESFNLYKRGVEEQLFIINDRMREVEFVNIGMIGFSLREFDWTDNFIETHSQYLSEETRSHLVPFVFAYKASFQKKHELVIKLLSQLSSQNHLRYLPKIKSLLIRAYFEGIFIKNDSYINSLNFEINSLKKMMIRNDKLSNSKAEGYINFIVLIKKLLNLILNEQRTIEEIQSIESLLTNINPLASKAWLMDKILEIKSASLNKK